MPAKNYVAWHQKKVALNDSTSHAYFYEREVWWVAIGHNIGDEEDGKGYNFARPVLIVKKFNRSLFYGLPLTTAIKQGRYYLSIIVGGTTRTALLSHLRDYDARRLINKLDTIDQAEFTATKKALASLINQ